MTTEPDLDTDEWELIPEAEPPLCPRELDRALAGYFARTERRKFYRVMKTVGLVVFRA